ncbi:hypothetical protein NGRA_1843 [Nosema granulosis]|uniref:Uncharacterized protein n=1 Tax=Nosema granulosis TaxID=83296 RepID=A0A9P6H113_9MICR|nr:hypothetical protein NGRA_1843 [Nosema granulosis]
MQEVENFFNVLFIGSPAIGFIPQILSHDILFPEVLSVLAILANVLKLLHYSSEPFSPLIALQAVFIIVLHCYLIHFNPSNYSSIENNIFRVLKLTKLNKRYGTKAVYTTLIITALITFHLMGYLVSSMAFCGILSLVVELSINVLQVMIESDKKELIVLDGSKVKRSPKELYLFWMIGDVVKIWYMMKVASPNVYIMTTILQFLLDGYLFFT